MTTKPPLSADTPVSCPSDAMIAAGIEVLDGPNCALGRPWKAEKVEKIYLAMEAARTDDTHRQLVEVLKDARSEIKRMVDRYGAPHSAVVMSRIDALLTQDTASTGEASV